MDSVVKMKKIRENGENFNLVTAFAVVCIEGRAAALLDGLRANACALMLSRRPFGFVGWPAAVDVGRFCIEQAPSRGGDMQMGHEDASHCCTEASSAHAFS